jgi:hypothetical protein
MITLFKISISIVNLFINMMLQLLLLPVKILKSLFH